MPRRAPELDLLLINPGGHERVYQRLGTTLAAKEPPIWVGLYADHARRQGLRVAILDANALGLGSLEAAQLALEHRARLHAIVVFGHNPNASTQIMPGAGALATELKALDAEATVLMVGGHVAALPDRTLTDESVDFVCDGEGPRTLVALAQALAATGTPELQNVEGLVWNDDGKIRHNAPARLVQDLDVEMPGIAWDLLPMEHYRAHNWHCFGGIPRAPYAAIYTTLGCPFRCSFCCIQAPFKTGEAAAGYRAATNSYRRWSPTRIGEELELLQSRYDVHNVKLADELFVLHQGATSKRICDEILQPGARAQHLGLCPRRHLQSDLEAAREDAARGSALVGDRHRVRE